MGVAELKEMQRRLDRQEAKTHGGAAPRSTKAHLLDATDMQEKFPDRRVRWIQVGNSERAQSRIHKDGYTLFSTEEGGRRVGGLALAWIPREEYERRNAEIRRRNEERLKSHEVELQRVAESIARELSDRYGIRVDSERIFVKE